MISKSFLNHVLIFAASLFCRCLPFTFSRPIQPPCSQPAPVAYQAHVRRSYPQVRATSTIELITEWRQELEILNNQENLQFKILENYQTRYSVNKSAVDLYMFFIESKKGQLDQNTTSLERHHIVPRFDGGGNDEENLISLTPEDHKLAHFLRFLEYGKTEDAAVVLFRCGYIEEARRLSQKNALTKMKQEKKGWWNPKAQSERGKKGGKKGGSVNSQAQFEARQAVGKKYGQETGLKNQGSVLKEILQYHLKWVHESFPKNTFFTLPSQSGNEIINQLEKFVPNQIINRTTFYKVFNSERPQMYGWKIIGKEIRSEAEGGLGPSERSETST